jgi:hypothetical protein
VSRRRVLLVVSSYSPAMLADMQRARALAWELPALGWDVEILTPAAAEVRQDAIEADDRGFFAPSIPVHEVYAWAPSLFRLVTLGTGTWRMWWPMFWRGRTLLATGRFDLVYFSTTAFNFFAFGPPWRRRFNVPYVLDFQDPWTRPQRIDAQQTIKNRLSAVIDPLLEKPAVGNAAGLVAVSPNYVDDLKRRYAKRSPLWLQHGRHEVIPFCAIERDLAEALGGLPSCAAPPSPELSVIYVGAGPTMHRSFALVCSALSRLRKRGDDLAGTVRIRLFGTGSFGRHDRTTELLEMACGAGIGDLVEEQPQRVSYRRALALLGEARGLLILGVDDPGYMPSKLFTYALSGKPLLACVRRDGPAYALLQAEPRLGRALWFDAAGAMPLDKAEATFRLFLEDAAAGIRTDRRAMLEAHLAPAMARRHVALFDACLAGVSRRSG